MQQYGDWWKLSGDKKRKGSFTFRVNREDVAMLRKLAEHLNRSHADAIRTVVKAAVEQLERERLGRREKVEG